MKPQGGKTLSYVYNRVTTLPTAATRALNTEYTAQEAGTTQITVNLAIFGGSFELDRVLQADENQVLDLVQFQLQQKSEAARAKFHDLFINGDKAVDPNGFEGLAKMIKGKNTEITPAAAIDLSSSANIDTNWKAFMDVFRKIRSKMDGAPSLHLMNADMFAVFQSVLDRAGLGVTSKDQYGGEVIQFGTTTLMALGDKPGTSTPIIGTDGSSGETDIYSIRLGMDGVHAVSPDGTALVTPYMPDFTKPGAVKKGEVEMVAAAVAKSTRCAAVLHKIKIG